MSDAQLLARDSLDRRLFVDALFVEHRFDRLVGHVPRDAALRELLLHPAPRMTAAQCLRARELPGEVRVVEQAGALESLDGGVDVAGRLALLDQQCGAARRPLRARASSMSRARSYVDRFARRCLRASTHGDRDRRPGKKEPGSRSLFRREFPGPIVARLLLPGSILPAGVRRRAYSSVTSMSLITSRGPTPSNAFTFSSTSAISAGLSLRYSFAFSRPCPIFWPL